MTSRVLILTTDSKICGTERVILSLLQNLDRSEFEPMLVTLKGPGDLVTEAQKLNLPAINLQLDQHKLSGIKQWRQTIKHFQPQILHSFLFHSNLLARATHIFTKTPVISGIRTVYSKEAYGIWYARLERFTHRWDKFYVANSLQGLESARRIIKLSPQKLVLIRNGIPEINTSPEEAQECRQSVRHEFGYDPSHLVVGIVAQLRPAKRHDLLIQSVAQLKDQFPQLRLIIVGGGERQTELQQLAQQYNIADSVTFTGYRADAQRLLQGMDLFALPSEVEGQPVSIMEAMQHALPVIATTVGGIPDIAIHQQTALLCPPGNLDAFTQSLTTLLHNEPLRKTLGQNGQIRIQQDFSAQNMNQRFIECYRACLR